jgi:hypothetical protein
MIWVLVLLLILLTALGYVLLAPFYLELDSRSGLCRFRFHRLASARLAIVENTLILHLWVAGWQKQLDLLEKLAGNGKPSQKKIKENLKRDGKRPNVPMRKIWGIVRSFKVNTFLLSFDAGNVRTNGLLFPWFLLAGRLTGKPIGINFLKENDLVLEIENSFFRILRAYFST